jgi:carbon storage regulator
MLVLTRRHGESVRIGPDVKVTVVSSTSGQVRIAIDAPEHVGILREEIFERVASANVEAAALTSSTVTDLGAAAIRAGHQSGGGINE